MKRVSVTKPRSDAAAAPALRKAQTGLTRDRIEQAVASLFDEHGGPAPITFKAVAERAGVTEMTVYRHYPTREELLKTLWRRLNAQMGDVGMPETLAEMYGQHDALFTGFDRIAPQIVASITTPQGREMRASLNKQRRKAFLAIVDEIAPDLTATQKAQAAAVIQLLHSAYAWDSLREQWGLNGKAAGKATRWAIEAVVANIRRTT
jgi:AcrR family transcriptional regulator